MFNGGASNISRVLVLVAFTRQTGQQYPTDAWKFWDIYHTVLKGTEYEYFKSIAHSPIRITILYTKTWYYFFLNDVIFIDNDVSDWSISLVSSYLIGQSFCISIGQLFMKLSFPIGFFSSILICEWAIDWNIRVLSLEGGVVTSLWKQKKSKHIIQTWKTIEYRRIEGLHLPCSMTVLSIVLLMPCLGILKLW
jgi:hypothetical protein